MQSSRLNRVLRVALFSTGCAVLPAPTMGQGVGPAKSASLALEKTTLAEGIYLFLFRAPSALDLWTSSNTVVVVNDSDVVVFGSNARASTSRMVIAEIRRITTSPVRVLINSHWHMDHWLGNAAYADAFPGLQIIATTETRDYMSRLPLQFFINSAGAVRARVALDTAIATGKTAKWATADSGTTPATGVRSRRSDGSGNGALEHQSDDFRVTMFFRVTISE